MNFSPRLTEYFDEIQPQPKKTQELVMPTYFFPNNKEELEYVLSLSKISIQNQQSIVGGYIREPK
jgi:hypothetical protein